MTMPTRPRNPICPKTPPKPNMSEDREVIYPSEDAPKTQVGQSPRSKSKDGHEGQCAKAE